ncbi:MAG: hypothetical protein CMI60_22695 [Parvibaculum sp.]|mgnify:FL=1|nr:hypothetical protein [Parvibaculum sp.]|tara:strand:+ start:127 stop:498 length:372 start_codon:yes stop_codon:yes gene_type:complete
MNTLQDALNEEHFYICLKPEKVNGKWLGGIEITALVSDNHGLEPSELEEVLHVLHMICASVPLYETDKDVRDKAYKLVEKAFEETEPDAEYLFGDAYEEEESDTSPQLTYKGNVVKVDFGVKN